MAKMADPNAFAKMNAKEPAAFQQTLEAVGDRMTREMEAMAANPAAMQEKQARFGCGGQSQCVVVDPFDDLAPYLQASRDTGMRIAHVIDTHVHADHVSGGRALAEAAGVPYLVHGSAAVEGATPIQDGDRLVLIPSIAGG